MNKTSSLARPSLLSLCALWMASGAARANDFPTVDRVLYVQ